jgi:uncharacterized membrane protein
MPCILSNRKVHYRAIKSLPAVPVLSQMHPIHALSSNLLGVFAKFRKATNKLRRIRLSVWVEKLGSQ